MQTGQRAEKPPHWNCLFPESLQKSVASLLRIYVPRHTSRHLSRLVKQLSLTRFLTIICTFLFTWFGHWWAFWNILNHKTITFCFDSLLNHYAPWQHLSLMKCAKIFYFVSSNSHRSTALNCWLLQKNMETNLHIDFLFFLDWTRF